MDCDEVDGDDVVCEGGIATGGALGCNLKKVSI